MTVWAVVPAAGTGARMGAAVPKQYLPLGGEPVIRHSLRRLAAAPGLREIVVVLSPDDRRFASLPPLAAVPVSTARGGSTRRDSVLSGLDSLAGARPSDWVLVHDAARPCVPRSDVARLIGALKDHPVGGLLGAPVDDALKEAERTDGETTAVATAGRGRYWRALTPQMFRYGPLRDALSRAARDGAPVSDEAMAMERAGHRPVLVAGDPRNIKITRAEDLALAALILAAGEEEEA